MVILFAAVVIVAFITDVRKMIIPNELTAFAALSGVSWHLISEGWPGLWFAGMGLATGFALLVGLYAAGALGAGDVKLFAGIGAMMGTVFVFQCVLYSLLLAGLIGLLIALFRKMTLQLACTMTYWAISFCLRENRLRLRDFRQMSSIRFPFMYAVLPGAAVALWYHPLPV
ncbi:prepilin peptidase [Paenibacillus athensensis]|uniref:A24 family peptidase n=1 Tax=Paenibacillus athensensis TaxID=1967502 RepID=UPI00106FA8ED|nr:A24 family peptidase [Paenibacillus athensensis]MCD1257477.1 prepilin peptidase [Paenibacillus athensensis]